MQKDNEVDYSNDAVYCSGLNVPHKWVLTELSATCERCGIVLPPWKSEWKNKKPKSVRGKRAPKRDKWQR